MTNQQSPIGLFDSGVGGLTVDKALQKHLPQESLVYFGDTARLPYGKKSPETVQLYCKQILEFLLERHKVKMVVVACNSATAMSLEYLQSISPVPVVGVIEPGASRALAISQNHRIGLVATEGTVRSEAYQKSLKAQSQADVFCYAKPTPMFVNLVEESIVDQKVISTLLNYYLEDFKSKDIDTLILGCTHFPLLQSQIQDYFGESLQVVDSAETTASFVKKMLKDKGLLHSQDAEAQHQIYVSDCADRFIRIAKSVLQVPELKAHLHNFTH